MEISTSILSVKEENSIETFYRLETAHTDYFHIDVMDGKFVKNDTTEMMQKYADNLKNITNIPLDVHLMVENVKEYIDLFSPCNPRVITFHIENKDRNNYKSKEEVMETITYIKENNAKVGISVCPETPIEKAYEYLPYIHNILIMTVHPGEGGQKMIPEVIQKIVKLKKYISENNFETEIEVDGGINMENISELKSAGVDIAVVGTYMINAKDYKYTMNMLKNK